MPIFKNYISLLIYFMNRRLLYFSLCVGSRMNRLPTCLPCVPMSYVDSYCANQAGMVLLNY